MKKRIWNKVVSIFTAILLVVGIVPNTTITALAAEGAPSSLNVGNYQITSGDTPTYLKAGSTAGSLVAGSENDWTVKYEPSTATLTLNGATIQGGTSTGSVPYGAGIYAQCNSGESVSLTIKLIGGNTITGYYGIYVNAEISADSNGTDASLTITGENNVSLEVSGSFYGIFVKSGTGNASVTIENASVDAKTTQTNSGYAGVCVQSGASSKDSPNLSLAVNGGSLTTSGSASGDGIQFVVGAHVATRATTSLTVTDNAIVDARNGGISASRTSVTLPTPTPTGNNSSGIVFDGTKGTVYGNVTLQEDLEIGEGESLTIGKDASLTVPGGTTLTNNGTIVNTGGALNGEPGGTGKIETTPTIDTQPASQTVTAGETAEFSVTATGENLSYQWQKITDNGSSWMDITGETNTSYTIATTTTYMNDTQYRCVVSNSAGSVESNAATLTVSPKQYAVTVQTDGNGTASASTTAAAAGTEITLTATPDSGYHFERWEVVSGTITIQNDKFIMPAENVTVKAVFDRNSSGGGGSYSLPEGIDRDEPEEQPEEEPDEPSTPETPGFIDVDIFDWYHDGVMYVTENGIMSGVGGNRFEPETELKREMLAVILWNMTDNPEPNGIAPFLDVTSDKYYAKAIAWANENGVMYGYGEEFGVGEAVTREDFAAILYRYAAFKGYDTTQGGMAIREFIDFEQIADYAAEALGWAVNSGIISGMGDGTISPKATANRGQAAVMLMKFCENVIK